MHEAIIDVVGIPGLREPISSISHLIGAAVFAILSVDLVRRGRGDWPRTISLAVMSAAAVMLLYLSGVYHLFEQGEAREFLRRLDVASVFVLIAATITPIYTILFTGFARWGPLVLVWSAAATGITLRMLYFYSLPGVFNLVVFLGLGWAGATSAVMLWRRHGFIFIRSLVAGGVAYSLGAILLELHWPTLIPGFFGPHELWHAAVLAGLSFHWHFVTQIANENLETRS